MHRVTQNIARSPRQHDDIAALEGANGRICLLDFKNAASLKHDQEGDILAVWCGGVSPGSCEGMDACDQPVETNRVEHILQHVNGHQAGSSCGNIWTNESQKRTNPMRFEHFSLLYYSTGVQRVPLTRKKRVCPARKTKEKVMQQFLPLPEQARPIAEPAEGYRLQRVGDAGYVVISGF